MIEGDDGDLIKEKTDALAQASMKLGEAMYKASQAEAEAKANGTDDEDEDDVVDARRIDRGTLHQCLQDRRPQVAGVELGQAAPELADGGADGRDDCGAAEGHCGSLAGLAMPLSNSRAISPEERPSCSARISSLCWPLRGAEPGGPRTSLGSVANAPAAG